MTVSRTMRWITGSLELVLAIPVLGGLIVLVTSYFALPVMLILHLITLVLSSINREPIAGSVVGVVTSLLAWIPFLGWALHLTSTIILMITASQKGERSGAPMPKFQ
ncbi:hypothetical protein ACFQZE_17130 [Paenibacillus sp. GCM10027627]|uniref:hypothetical protein n=1 Tax=unclassified Paenibacillus TaxID=185978 RepID=UPI003635172C